MHAIVPYRIDFRFLGRIHGVLTLLAVRINGLIVSGHDDERGTQSFQVEKDIKLVEFSIKG